MLPTNIAKGAPPRRAPCYGGAVYAIVVGDGAGAPLEWRRVADPQPQPHEALVRIHATAVNRADLLQRRGGYDPPPGAPPWLGLEMAGVVASAGPCAAGFAAGDRVCSILPGGGYAEAVAADPRYLMPLPEALSFVEGGGLPEVFLTAYVNLFMEAGLAAGETVLVHGGASGVGTAAIQLARRAGATVCVTARSAAKLAACRELGAQVTANHATEDWAQVIAAAAGGVDVILDCVGADYLARNLRLLRPARAAGVHRYPGRQRGGTAHRRPDAQAAADHRLGAALRAARRRRPPSAPASSATSAPRWRRASCSRSSTRSCPCSRRSRPMPWWPTTATSARWC